MVVVRLVRGICHLLVEATHLHIIKVVHNPDDIQKFMRHFKTDSADFLNKILGRKRRTVWQNGYDSPRVLSFAEFVIGTP
jgi:hypothetical protein